ncbi:protein Wnt-4a [Trichinella spiralis]|uniref:protein Wnt-4a n=1 Tax=Trichinella spiralis TaxID=6334 RepID=UPI0001EFC61C|nr:protein Wnt-4a [Trichinella spiralis]
MRKRMQTDLLTRNLSQLDGELQKQPPRTFVGSREAAFVYSISTASVVHSIARSCSTSQISDCSCDRRRVGRGQDSQGEFSWGGCSDNLPYAISFARKFIDSKDRRSRDGRALMNLHNNRAGRKAVKRNLKIQCKCHGVSGSCATRTCWRALPHLSIIGADLADKYHEALQVTVNPNGEGLIPADHRRYDFLYGPKAALFQRKRINRAELVYFEPSPDYCEADIRTGKISAFARQDVSAIEHPQARMVVILCAVDAATTPPVFDVITSATCKLLPYFYE